MKLEKLLKNKFLYSEKKNIIKYLYFFIHKFFKKKVKKYYSATGIDLLINYLFKNKDNGIYLDVGCYHPIRANNTFLLHKKGWKGINIDIDYHTVNMFNFFRPKDFNKQIAISDKSDEVDFYFYHNRSSINTLSNEIYKYRRSRGAEIKKIKTKSLNSIIEESQQLHVVIDTRDGLTRGQTIVDYFDSEGGEKNVRVVTKSSKEKFIELLMASVS